MESTLKAFFGFSSFRPFQREIVERILQGQDCLAVMATGGGKSLCYQLPPLVIKKVATVISPLISLMQDQVMSLKERGIKAEYLGSAQTDNTVVSRALKGEYDILYMTPEKALNVSDRFWSTLLHNGASLVAVDEAHCISEWGHDFRQEYQQLHKLRAHLPDVPFVALTATATERVRGDIVKSLHMRNAYTVISTFDRPNLFYGVKMFNRSTAFRDELALEVSKDVKAGGSTIIYCTTIKDVEEVTKALNHAGVKAQAYHGQMNQVDRDRVHRAFARDELQIIVATVAFGMGIDKPDIRCVIHYGCPKSLESYYQESGRCGRDGLPSVCLLYYTRADFSKTDFYTAEVRTVSRWEAVVTAYKAAQKYCSITTCRRRFILEYFGECVTFENCGKCDNCTRSRENRQRDMSEEVQLLLLCVKMLGGRFGLGVPVDVLRGSHSKKVVQNGYDKLPVYGLGRCRPANWWKSLGDQLLNLGYLKEHIQDQFRFVNLGPKGEHFLQVTCSQQIPLVLPVTEEMSEEEIKRSGNSQRIANSGDGSSFETNLLAQDFSKLEAKFYSSLLEERAELARRSFTSPYAICSENTLRSLAKLRPLNVAQLLSIDGVNQWLVRKHGDAILKVIRKLSTELGLYLDSPKTSRQSMQPRLMSQVHESKMSSAKVEAWQMWQEEGLSFSRIANLPVWSAPIREETVVQYILDCIRAGYRIDWIRFCKATGFTKKIAEEVSAGIGKAGSKYELKRIKQHLPEHVSFLHIRMYLLMEDVHLPFPSTAREESELIAGTQEEDSHDSESLQRSSADPFFNHMAIAGSRIKEYIPSLRWTDKGKVPPTNEKRRAHVWRNEFQSETHMKMLTSAVLCDASPLQGQKNRPFQVTEEALLVWLSTHDGASFDAILSAFPTSKDFLHELLSNLEGDFLIHCENGNYGVM